MNFTREYIQLAQDVFARAKIPDVTGIHLPHPVDETEKQDEFGFVFLEDGTAAPFYTSLDDTLHQLWTLYPDGHSCTAQTLGLVKNLDSDSAALKALAVGAFNAMSQYVMAAAGYSPLKSAQDDKAYKAGQQIGMVGYFRPLVERYLQQGVSLLVLEKNPARVEMQAGIELSNNPADLLNCEQILCTASTLINGSLREILQYKKASAHFSLVGPSGSGLPDILFRHGVDDVGGIMIKDLAGLKKSLSVQQSWGHAGNKYQISKQDYPGVSALLETISGS